ncbi:hypothetical protein IWZ03DRAFT_49210 [Phyllosticta citriasiana]|uniref:Uncharacterized protein n=1 Tax=Phyllosticta citriasiana TaxID=595635 RepID=A0ABR1KCP6_9PEZI
MATEAATTGSTGRDDASQSASQPAPNLELHISKLKRCALIDLTHGPLSLPSSRPLRPSPLFPPFSPYINTYIHTYIYTYTHNHKPTHHTTPHHHQTRVRQALGLAKHAPSHTATPQHTTPRHGPSKKRGKKKKKKNPAVSRKGKRSTTDTRAGACVCAYTSQGTSHESDERGGKRWACGMVCDLWVRGCVGALVCRWSVGVGLGG